MLMMVMEVMVMAMKIVMTMKMLMMMMTRKVVGKIRRQRWSQGGGGDVGGGRVDLKS